MTSFPYCKAKKLEIRHIGSYPDDVILAKDVEAMLKVENQKIRDMQREIALLHTDISRIYDASNS